MVRLQLRKQVVEGGLNEPFNPTMVRLQPRCPPPYSPSYPAFNPTMVRLQLLLCDDADAEDAELSIPLWCDCNPTQPPTNRQPNRLSIPLWCDCNCFPQLQLPSQLPLSIPLWCDCNQEYPIPIRMYHIAFNPTMVRLQPAPRGE